MDTVLYNWDYVRSHQGIYESEVGTIVIVGCLFDERYTTMVQFSLKTSTFAEVNVDGNGWAVGLYKKLNNFTFNVKER